MNKFLKLSLTVSSLILIGCGSGGSKNTTPNISTKKINGKVADGYVKNAKVCIDLNNNFKCDENEPFTYSDTKGDYLIDIGDNKNHILISTGGIDTETNQPAITMYSNTKYKNITPLTSLAIKYGEEKVTEFYNIKKSEIAADPEKDNEIKNIVKDIVNLKIVKGEYALPATNTHILIDTKHNINKNNEKNSTENNSSGIIKNDINKSEENINIKNGDENIPSQITGNLTPPQIGE
jgi:hypothetical protein